MANIIDDLGNAIKTTISNASALFSAIASPGGTLAVEYEPESESNFAPGAYGRCLVQQPENDPAMEAVPGTDYDESAQSIINFDLLFDLSSVQNKQTHRAIIEQAVHATFRDRGKDMFANFTDNGSNRLGSSGRVVVGATTIDAPMIDGSRFRTRISVVLWHVVPLA